jgi:AraC-like DNA-binding protein
MEYLNFVNLIQAGIVATGILGGLLLWITKPKEFRGVAVLLFSLAFASCINIVEESGLTRDIYLISPIFIMAFGPVIYLAAKSLINKALPKAQWWHLLPVIPLLFFTSYTYFVIAIGTVWRLAYALLTMIMLLKYKKSLDEERSDSDDFSLNWLVWVLAVTATFNLIDLIRLNFQQAISYELNVLGQGINNAIWLVVVMIIIIKLQAQKNIPQRIEKPAAADPVNQSTEDDYNSLFEELDTLITSNQWFLKPRLTLSDVSTLTGLQTRDISRSINLVTDKSFNQYVNNYRVDYVCSVLMNDTKKPLLDIAYDAGFSSKASFNKVFKEISGMTPTEYKSRK